MEKKPSFQNQKNKILILVIFSSIFLAILVALLSPPEKTLGNIAKFIYLHAALSWVGVLIFTLAGVWAIGFILLRKYHIFVQSDAFEKTAIIIWFIHFLMGIVSMKIAWGAIFWQEPRFLTATLILLSSLALYIIAQVADRFLISAILYLANTVIVWGLLTNTERVFHPINPIMGGRSLNIKLYAGVITIFLFIATLGVTNYFKRRLLSTNLLNKLEDSKIQKPKDSCD